MIVVEPGHSIGVYWDDFDVERHPSCDYDYVKLFNGPSIQDPMIGNYCNPNPADPNYRPPDIHTASNYLTILFQSDFSVSTAGWKLRKVSNLISISNWLPLSTYDHIDRFLAPLSSAI